MINLSRLGDRDMNYWCNNCIMVEGNYMALRNLERTIDAYRSLAKLYRKEEDILSFINEKEKLNLSCHGEINDMELGKSHDAKNYTLFISYDSGYLPEVKFWQEMVKREAPGCKIYWYSYAARRRLCLSNDLKKKYFDFDYCLDLNMKENDHPLAKEFGNDSITTESNETLEKQLRNVYGPHSLEEMIEMVKNEDFKGIHICKVMDGTYLDTKE